MQVLKLKQQLSFSVLFFSLIRTSLFFCGEFELFHFSVFSVQNHWKK